MFTSWKHSITLTKSNSIKDVDKTVGDRIIISPQTQVPMINFEQHLKMDQWQGCIQRIWHQN